MKVFVNHRIGEYGGGMILVAANSAEEAHIVFHNDPDFFYMWQYIKSEDRIIDSYYKKENWKEISTLVSYNKKPYVIDEGGYSE